MVQAGEKVRGWLNIGLTAMLLVCAAVILATAAVRWIGGPAATEEAAAGTAAEGA